MPGDRYNDMILIWYKLQVGIFSNKKYFTHLHYTVLFNVILLFPIGSPPSVAQ